MKKVIAQCAAVVLVLALLPGIVAIFKGKDSLLMRYLASRPHTLTGGPYYHTGKQEQEFCQEMRALRVEYENADRDREINLRCTIFNKFISYDDFLLGDDSMLPQDLRDFYKEIRKPRL